MMDTAVKAYTPCIVIEAQAEDEIYTPIGAIGELILSQNREFIQTTDREGNVVFEPGRITNTINLKRMVIDSKAIAQMFGSLNTILNLQDWSFNFRIVDRDLYKECITTYDNCLIVSMTRPVQADEVVIVREATIICENILEDKFVND